MEFIEIEKQRKIQRVNKAKNWFFEKLNMIEKPLDQLSKRHSDCIQTNKIRKGKGKISTENEDIQKLISQQKNLQST